MLPAGDELDRIIARDRLLPVFTRHRADRRASGYTTSDTPQAPAQEGASGPESDRVGT